jgi:type 1 fimbriae regulatory protein FimB
MPESKNDRKHLTGPEVGKLIAAAEANRNAARDRCILLLMFRHGLRVSELCAMKQNQIDLDARVLHVQRLKKGLSTTHPLRADEMRAIRAYLKPAGRGFTAHKHGGGQLRGRHFFGSERGGALSRKTVWAMIRDCGRRAGLAIDAHPHMLRHACGFALADQGADTRLIQDYLGHRNIQHTVRYTAANPARFERLWR